jgi:NADH-quinone oxidoreductase subunit F
MPVGGLGVIDGMSPASTDRVGVLRVPAGDPTLREAVADAEVAVRSVGPTGIGSLAPLLTATCDGRTALYPACPPERAADVAATLASGTLAEKPAAAVVSHDADARTLPRHALAGLDLGERRVLGGAGWRRPTNPDDHRAAGGFVGAEAGEVIDTATTLRGRGWGDWHHDEPVVEGWRMLHDDDRAPAVVVNAHGPLDAHLAESVPFEVLEGACDLARAVDANRVVVYCSAAAETATDRVRDAADAYPDPPAPVAVETGPDVYRAAEPTMALEAIEGNHRLEARLRSPGSLPTLVDRPALVHTARTLAHLAVAVRTGEAPATRLVSVTGDVAEPAIVELPAEGTLETALDAVDLANGFKAACVGGRFGGLTDSLDLAPTPERLADADLGTEGSVEVLGRERCVLCFVGRRTRFAAEANCGRCVPCREGAKQLVGRLRDVFDGEVDRDGIAELVRTMTGASLCAFGVQAGRPARTALTAFDEEVAAHADGRCPTGACSAEVP